MSGRTKLYQRTGSPLIQGDSKRDVPARRVWLSGFMGGLLIAWLAMFVYYAVDPSAPDQSLAGVAVDALIAVAIAGLPGALIGAWLGTSLARGMGWSRPGAVSMVLACVLALAGVFVALFALGWSLPA
jgi:hypothetical protein